MPVAAATSYIIMMMLCEVTLVGLREWILKPYVQDLQELKSKLTNLEAQVQEVNQRLAKVEAELYELNKNKADKERLRLIEKELEQVENITGYLFDTLRDLSRLAEAEEKGSGSEHSGTIMSEEELLLELIRRGYDSPRNLAKKAKIGVGRMYEILERLEAEGKIRTIKKGRKKKIIIIEG